MEIRGTKQILDFLLNSYRARLAVDDAGSGCPFDFTSFLAALPGMKREGTAGVNEGLKVIVDEGLLDSILPYLALAFRHTVEEEPSVTPQPPERRRVKEEDPDILIHVCDEGRGATEDFRCKQSVLVSQMGYFGRVAVKGQRLRDMDISVHCDVAVFDWLMKWVAAHSKQSSPPQLDATNVIGLLVSADFLKMPELTNECLDFTILNMDQILKTSPNLGCLSESLAGVLANRLDNIELETKIFPLDKSDRIASKFYTQFILALNESDPDPGRGHFASTATLFRCENCELLLVNDVAPKVPCTSMKLDSRGRIFACHSKDPTWTLQSHVRDLKKKLKTWRKVYWRLWGTAHFFSCSFCGVYFSGQELSTCGFHPKGSPFSNPPEEVKREKRLKGPDQNIRLVMSGGKKMEVEGRRKQTSFATFSCCGEKEFRFKPMPHNTGCRVREHSFEENSDQDPAVFRMKNFRDLIVDVGGCKKVLEPLSLLTLGPSEKRGGGKDLLPQPEEPHEFEVGSEGWRWNHDLNTRYNQDMQREREERLMIDLSLLLSQRLSLEPSLTIHNSFLSRRVRENMGGSFLKLDQNWREDNQSRGRTMKSKL